MELPVKGKAAIPITLCIPALLEYFHTAMDESSWKSETLFKVTFNDLIEQK